MMTDPLKALPALAPDDGSWTPLTSVDYTLGAPTARINGLEYATCDQPWSAIEFFVAIGRRRYRIWIPERRGSWHAERIDDLPAIHVDSEPARRDFLPNSGVSER